MTKTNNLFTALFVAALLLVALPTQAATVSAGDLSAGDLIRGESYSSVYYFGDDGFRYVFPNDKTYFTWYEDFDSVNWLSDSDLASIQIGGNVTYKPGVKMVKITSDPTVYVVGTGGTLRAIESEEVAQELYGSNWAQQVDDVPDGFFSNYSLGSRVELASQFSSDAEQADAFSISRDKKLARYVSVGISDVGYDGATITIDSGTAVRFTNVGNDEHSATEWDRAWGSGTLQPGDHFTHYFTQTGIWHYYSIYDDRTQMSGAIIVN